MTKKSKRILTDTVVIIDAHSNGYWNSICNAYQIVIPASVLENEAFYFDSESGKCGMNSTEWIKEGKVTRIEATLKDYADLSIRLKKDFMDALDEGEREALAILNSNRAQQLLFCSADRAALKALGILGLSHNSISIEELLENCGQLNKKKLPKFHTKKWFQDAIAEGFRERDLWLN